MSLATPGFRIDQSIPQLDPGLILLFSGAGSSQVADAMNRMGSMDSEISPQWPNRQIVGVALTVWTKSADNLMLHKAIDIAERGHILVVNTQNNRFNAPFGELLGAAAVAKGIVGVIVDGVVRDVDSLAEMGLPTYARGRAPGGCEKRGPGEIGTPISCGHVSVATGDIVVADGDGVTVVPRAYIDAIAQKTSQLRAREEFRKSEIANGIIVRPEIDDTLRRARVIE